jgi:cardiolipin synthase
MGLQVGQVKPLVDEDPLSLAMNRAVDGRPVAGNAVRHLADSPQALDAMLDAIARAERRVHLENYIIRGDQTGRRFADALLACTSRGVKARVLYDALGSWGTPARYWRTLRQAGVEVRAFHPLASTRPLDLFSRNHRKLLVVDGRLAILGGICLGDEWAGDPTCDRQPWRDTVVCVEGPAAMIIEQTFARVWALAGPALPPEALETLAQECGTTSVRVVDGIPGRTRIARVAQLAYDTSVERIWIWDAYLAAPPPLSTALMDAARGGVDVRVLVPSNSDVRLVRDITRVGYRDLLAAGVRVFEWRGTMLHAKAMLTDRRWVRVGSSNMNVSSLYANHELDVVIESQPFNEEFSQQFLSDMTHSNEIVLRPGRYWRRGRAVDADAPPEVQPEQAPRKGRRQRTAFERQLATVVTLRRIAGGIRRKFTAAAAGIFAILGVLLVVFPRPTGLVLGAICFTISGMIAFEGLRLRPIDDRRKMPRSESERIPATAPPAKAAS